MAAVIETQNSLMRLASVAKVKHQLSEYRPSGQDPEEPEWKELAKKRLDYL